MKLIREQKLQLDDDANRTPVDSRGANITADCTNDWQKRPLKQAVKINNCCTAPNQGAAGRETPGGIVSVDFLVLFIHYIN